MTLPCATMARIASLSQKLQGTQGGNYRSSIGAQVGSTTQTQNLTLMVK